MARLILLGLDGASLEGLRNATSLSNLPNFEKFLKNGSCSPLSSVYPYVTAPAWTSMFSGVNPGKHGIFDLLEYGKNLVRIPNMRSTDVPFLWDYLSWAGKRLIVAGVPFIYPAPSLNGSFVTGRFVPKLSHYPDNLNEFDLTGYEYKHIPKNTGRLELGKEYLRRFDMRADISLQMVDTLDWDLAILVDSLPDQLLHKFLDREDFIADMYRRLDNWLGKLLSRLNKDDALAIVSDHGFGEKNFVIYINEWLRRKGYLDFGKGKVGYIKDTIDRIMRWIKLRGIQKETNIEQEKVYVEGWPSGHKKPVPKPPGRSRAYAFRVETMAWLKVLDESCMHRLLKDLEELKDAGAIKDIIITKEYYRGSHTLEAPAQLLLVPEDDYSFSPEQVYSNQILKKVRTSKGGHKMAGLFAIYGRYTNLSLNSPSILDITPTVLDYFSLPMPPNLDGFSLLGDKQSQDITSEVSKKQ